ncbi:MAG: tryptophan-rich sensory protein [Mycobacteriaceae bacterium]|nr:tryptophan-rich sensory protein [Mycobacteriaceae bacterium]MBV9638806.1 tryptophan-rich sensory protein [Mycobacteriaceae bacterium]
MRATTLIGTVVPVAAAAVAGSLATRPAESRWYRRLRKPRYQPPRQAFPIVWTLLYADLAISSAATIDRSITREQALDYLRALGVNLALNASWSWLFFNRHMLKTSAAVAAALALSSADLTRRADRRVAPVLGLYPLWCAFASVLAAHIWQLNH